MIQDIAPHIYHNEYSERMPGEDAVVLFFKDNGILVRHTADGGIRYFEKKDLAEGFVRNYQFLFVIDDQEYYLAIRDTEDRNNEWTSEDFPQGWEFVTPRYFRTAFPRHLAFAGITGYQLSIWYRDHAFCGRCGTRTVHDHKERMLQCPSCGTLVYPVICPAVIVAVTHKEKILMTKYAGGAYRKYALIAGFTEIGETIEETVRREVMEEVGLKVKNLRYYKSQPWSFSGTVLMGFFCEMDGDDEDAIRLDENELSEAAFYMPDEIPDDDETIALTREMMTVWKESNGTY